jgi:hypothetical protein
LKRGISPSFANEDMPEPIVIPEQKNYEYSYGLAFKIAAEKLQGIPQIQEQCRRSGALCELSAGGSSIILKYLNLDFCLTLPEIEISRVGSQETVELRDKILMLHYLIRAEGTPLSDQLITYPELKEGANYFPSFHKRAVKPLIDYFGPLPEKLLKAAEPMGAVKSNLGDVSVTIPAFPRVPITLVLWKGDDEFPPNGNILFNSTILDYQPVEDVNILCQTIVWQMVKSLKETESRKA